MTNVDLAILLLAALGPLLILVRRVPAPDSLVLVGCGLATAFVPGLPRVQVDPALMLGLFLPPILYAGTVRLSWHLLRHAWHTGLAAGAVAAALTIGAVALAARAALPELSPVGAVLLGVVAALFDTRLLQEAQGLPHLPRAMADALKAREMAARVVALAAFGAALDVLGGEAPTVAGTLGEQVWAVLAGAAVGAAVGRAALWLRERADPAPVEVAISLATPYACALLARSFDLSLAVCVIAAALTVSAVQIDEDSGAPQASSGTRISTAAFWDVANRVLSATLYLLAGHELPVAVQELGRWPVWHVALVAAGLLGVVVLVQAATSWASTWFGPVARALRDRPGATRGRAAAAMAWASTRSVIGLVVALSIPAAGPDGQAYAERGLVLLAATFVVLGSSLVQGLTLNAVLRRAGLADAEQERHEEEEARRVLRDEGRASHDPAHPSVNEHDARRRALLALRREDRIGDAVLHRMLREVDLHSNAEETAEEAKAGQA